MEPELGKATIVLEVVPRSIIFLLVGRRCVVNVDRERERSATERAGGVCAAPAIRGRPKASGRKESKRLNDESEEDNDAGGREKSHTEWPRWWVSVLSIPICTYYYTPIHPPERN